MESNTHSTRQEPGGLDRLAAVVRSWRPRTSPDCQTVRRPRGCWRCAAWWTGWRGSGCGSWRGWMAVAPPARGTTPTPTPPSGGCGVGCAPGSPRPAAGSAPRGRCSAGPLRAPAGRWPPGTSPQATPPCSPTAPPTSRQPPPPRPSRCCWTQPAAWIRRGCGRSWPTCGTSPTPTPPTPAPSACMSAGGCGCRPPWRGWWRWTGCWSRRLGRRCWRPWTRWPARPAPRMTAVGRSVARMRWRSWPAATWRAAACHRPVGCAPR
jgi:hypothetical protein